MFKRIIIISIAALCALAATVFVDEVFPSYSPFQGKLGRMADRIINGGPQRMAVDMEDAVQLFDDTCMLGTVFKVPPYLVDDHFRDAGLAKDDMGAFRHPERPLHAYAFPRNEGKGHECLVHFVSSEDVDGVMRPIFDRFTGERLRRPMEDNPNAFQFALPENVGGPTVIADSPVIRSFATTDDVQYFVIFRPDSYSLQHVLQLIILPISELDAVE